MDWIEVRDKLFDGLASVGDHLNRSLLFFFGSRNERVVRQLATRVSAINEREPAMQALSDTELKEFSGKLQQRLADGATLEDILVDAFAACREAGRRFLKMRHYDVQLLGGMVLHRGMIAEMVTGEGKTLVATLAAYLNALAGQGVHVITVNDYLARRDAEWMSPLYQGLGLTVGAIQSNMAPWDRKRYYDCDITYGTNNEFGFDYLRDNMKPRLEEQAQGKLNYAIIDEVDSILIDEARTPLIISGLASDDIGQYRRANQIVQQLKRDVHFEVKEKERTCHLTDDGIREAERLVGVESFYTPGNMHWPHLIDNALKAYHLFKRDKDYMVEKGEVIIIDEHTGRKMEGRQWSDGLHQAVEAKENVRIKEETQTLATITFQNFFRLYNKISGMTGTAMTEAHEFMKIYKLDVVAIPTNRPLRRLNYPDRIYGTEQERWEAVIKEVKEVHLTGRPVLIGTTSVEKSERLSELFKRAGIKHEVLNAKNAEREAEIIAQAGRKHAVTISTNMAGRGTDIILGGNPETQAWAELRHQYPTRLEVPPEVWRQAIEPYEAPMKKEGREIAEPVATIELAKIAKTSDPEKYAQVVDQASESERFDTEGLAKKHGLEAEPLYRLINLYYAARPGGLHVVGTERHESRRIDNQLRGRAGRQGDNGSSRFFVSLDDDLMRIFAGEWVRNILQRFGLRDGEPIESPMVTRRLEAAQKKVEERNFEIRKNLLEYDEIMDTQRKRVYSFRQDILEGVDTRNLIMEMLYQQIDEAVDNFLDRSYGAKAFIAYANSRLGHIGLEARDFRNVSFDEATDLARDTAKSRFDLMLYEKLDEHLNEDLEQKDWEWNALTTWVNRAYSLQLKDYNLKRLSRFETEELLRKEVYEVIEKVSLEGAKDFFADDFGLKNLTQWANTTFGLTLQPQDLATEEYAPEPEPIASFLKQRVDEQYDRKEMELPVQSAMNRYMPDKQTHATGNYDRDGLFAWANSRFETDLAVEEFRSQSRQRVLESLLAASAAFRKKAKQVRQDLQAQLDRYLPTDANKMLSTQHLTELTKWCETELTLAPVQYPGAFVTSQEVRRIYYSLFDRRFRPEMRGMERVLLLQFLDTGWKDHLLSMDHLKAVIGLRGYAQTDTKVEYKREGRSLFEEMWLSLRNKVSSLVFRLEEVDPNFVASIWQETNAVHQTFQRAQLLSNGAATGNGATSPPNAAGPAAASRPAPAAVPVPAARPAGRPAGYSESHGQAAEDAGKVMTIRNRDKIGRNDPCWCGSGKKYKNCHFQRDRSQAS